MSRLRSAEKHADHLAQRAPSLTIIAERWLSIVIAAFLVLAGVLALVIAGFSLMRGLLQRGLDAGVIVAAVDHLLLVLMLVEILHTVRHSIEAHELEPEPFLIVGLIATVRRILMVTLMTSEAGGPEEVARNFNHNMIELGVLTGLTAVLVISIYVARQSRRS